MFGSLSGDRAAEGRCNPSDRYAFVALLLLTLTLTCGAANAQDCKPLNYLGGMPFSIGQYGRMETEAVINNIPTSVRLYPGDSAFMTHEAAKKFSLTEHASGMEMRASNGVIGKTYVVAPQFSVGPVAGNNETFMVFGSDATELPFVSLKTFANFDMDFDFSAKRLNLFSSDHCEGKVTYFSTGAIAAIPYEGDQFEIAVNLDDHATKAFFWGDGLESTMGLAEATKLFGLTSDSPGMEPVLKDDKLVGYRHIFSTLILEGITIKNTAFLIVPEKLKDMFKEKPTGSLIDESPHKDLRIEMAIGRNVQRQLHIYIATKEHKLYIAPGSEAAAKLLPPLKTTSAQ
jgi:hypothetical protein